MATVRSFGLGGINSRPWLRKLRPNPSFSTLACSLSPSIVDSDEAPQPVSTTTKNPTSSEKKTKSTTFFPKRGQTLELVCESLAFKAKGLCKVADTGFVVMCDRALPGERFIGRVTRKKDSYAEVAKLETISPHWDLVEAPCEYASRCGGCKTQNLLYEAQVRFKEQQVIDLVVHVGKFSDKDPEFSSIMKPIVPCDIQFHYRNKMEFSFGARKWLPKEQLKEERYETDCFALGLHAPGFFDKVLDVNKCLLQSEPANRLFKIVGEIHN